MPDEDGPTRRVRFDWTGYALLCVSLVCLMSGVANGQRIGWASDFITGCLGLGLVTGVLFVRSQLQPDRAILDLSMPLCREASVGDGFHCEIRIRSGLLESVNDMEAGTGPP